VDVALQHDPLVGHGRRIGPGSGRISASWSSDVQVIALLSVLTIVGLIVGAIARLLLPGRDPMGCLGTIVLGLAGSFVGGLLTELFFDRPRSGNPGLHPAGFIGSVIGAMILLLILRVVRRR
jgi:uncharacterized membrane protein YeaQ/YmgE (transglycosylase-associated protein family)